MNPILAIPLLASFAIFCLLIGIYKWMGWAREVEDRLAEEFTSSPQEANLRPSKSSTIDTRLNGTSSGARIQKQLVAANSSLTVKEFMLIRVGLAAAGLLLGWAISHQLLGGAAVAIVGWALPPMQLRRQISKRFKQFNELLPDVLSLLVGSLRAGYGLLHALMVIVDEMPDPISSEFDRVVRETSLGYTMDDALDHLVDRMGSDDLELMVTAVHIQNEVGGNLAEVLATITETIRDRIQLMGEIRVMTTSQRATGGILSAMPFAMGTILMLINPAYMMEMFQPGWPLLIPAGALIMIGMGNVVMRKVMQFEV